MSVHFQLLGSEKDPSWSLEGGRVAGHHPTNPALGWGIPGYDIVPWLPAACPAAAAVDRQAQIGPLREPSFFPCLNKVGRRARYNLESQRP